jgi:hypothetical protein
MTHQESVEMRNSIALGLRVLGWPADKAMARAVDAIEDAARRREYEAREAEYDFWMART